ncbi:hypothetical protein BHE74_00038139 [Ensete ventricosum]|nr:hypothetical protein BHE74_00038139 [Ensete ventricosum]
MNALPTISTFSNDDSIVLDRCQVDIPVKYLGFFLEDDAELDHIRKSTVHLVNFKEYGAGRMLTGEVKKRLVEVLSELVEQHQRARAAVTDEVSKHFLEKRLYFRMVDAFMAVRPLPYMFS